VSQLFLLDTNTVSYIVRGKSTAARSRLTNLQPGEITCISAITEGELRYGLAKVPQASTLTPAVEGFLGRIQVLAWGKLEAGVYGSLRANLEKSGRTLGNLDLLIAAHAVAVNAILVTRDRAFGQLSDVLTTVNWADDL
jgi:tRNA(fMet)-specific endonuclease VapC